MRLRLERFRFLVGTTALVYVLAPISLLICACPTQAAGVGFGSQCGIPSTTPKAPEATTCCSTKDSASTTPESDQPSACSTCIHCSQDEPVVPVTTDQTTASPIQIPQSNLSAPESSLPLWQLPELIQDNQDRLKREIPRSMASFQGLPLYLELRVLRN